MSRLFLLVALIGCGCARNQVKPNTTQITGGVASTGTVVTLSHAVMCCDANSYITLTQVLKHSNDNRLQPEKNKPDLGYLGATKRHYENGQQTAVEWQLAPFDMGIYFSLGGLHQDAGSKSVIFEANPQGLSYPTTITSHYRAKNFGILGFGYRNVYSFGGVLAIGGYYSPTFQTPRSVDVQVNEGYSDYTTEQKEKIIEGVLRDDAASPGNLYVSLGWSF